jgi:dihydropyrimidinase
VNVSIETLIQYLVLDKSDAARPEFEREVRHVAAAGQKATSRFWNGLAAARSRPWRPITRRSISRRKADGPRRFHKIPNGIPSLEDRVNLLYTHGVKTGKLDLHTFVNVASANAAKTFGLFPRKGCIQIGADADLVIYDPEYRGKISAKTQLMNVDYSAFEGWEIEGRPELVTVRGEVAVRDGKFAGTIGRGLIRLCSAWLR